MNNNNLSKTSKPTFKLDKLSEKWYTKNSIKQTNAISIRHKTGGS